MPFLRMVEMLVFDKKSKYLNMKINLILIWSVYAVSALQ
jgi:hypothetical protein